MAQHKENLSMHAENVALQIQHFIPTCGMGFSIIILILHLSVCASVCESVCDVRAGGHGKLFDAS